MKLTKIFLFFCLILYVVSRAKLKSRHKQSQCNKWTGSLSTRDKQIILNAHNWYRNKIAIQDVNMGPKLPFASNMLQMYWSDDIAKKAQEWANGCKFEHSKKDFRRQPDFPTGENLYTSKSSGGYQPMDWNAAVVAWFKEIKDFEGKSVDSFSSGGPVTGHFTQVIWANSYLVGCGFAQYEEGKWFTGLYVCQYGPVGNITGKAIYAKSDSKTCSCPQGTSCGNSVFPGLCCPDGNCDWKAQTYSGPLIPGTLPKGLA